MLTIVKPEKPAKSKNGDILYGEEYIHSIITKPLKNVYALNFIHHNEMAALRHLGVKNLQKWTEDIRYECPFYDPDDENSKRWYSWMWPVFISDLKIEEVHESQRKLMDFYIIKNLNPHFNAFPYNDKINSILGHGYTDGTMPSDGSGSKILVETKLSDGRSVYCLCWEWYNK